MNRIIERIKGIDEVYKKSFYIICGITFFVYFREIVSLKWTNNDFTTVFSSVPIEYTWYAGRLTSVLLQFLTGFKCITYISSILYLLGNILGLILLSKYWEIPKKVNKIVLFSLFYLLMPSTLCLIYYQLLSINFGCGLFFIVLSILTSLKINEVKTKKEKIIYFIVSYISLFVFVLGAYQPFINTILVVLLGKLLLNYIKSGYELSLIKKYINEHKSFFLVLILSVISEFCVFYYLKILNYVDSNSYTVRLINFKNIGEIINYFIYSIKLIYKLLFNTYPYIGMYVKVLLLIVVLLALIHFLIKIFKMKKSIQFKILKSIIFIFLLIITAWLSLFSYFVSPGYGGIMLRVTHIGYHIFYLLCFAMLLKFIESKVLNKIVIILSILIIYNSGINSIYAQQVLDLAFNAELKFQNRILSRIESHPDFSYDNKYKYISVGFYNIFKEKFYNGAKYNLYDLELYYNDIYNPLIYKYLTPYNFEINGYIPYYIPIDQYLKENEIEEEIKEYILNKAKAWPHKDSVFVSDKYIVVVLENYALNLTKEVFLNKEKNKNE